MTHDSKSQADCNTRTDCMIFFNHCNHCDAGLGTAFCEMAAAVASYGDTCADTSFNRLPVHCDMCMFCRNSMHASAYCF